LDNLTHTLVGVGMAEAFFKKRLGPAAVPVLAWSSNLPDIDAAVMLWRDPAAITWRRTIGHSIFLFPLWAAGLAWLFKKKYPEQKFSTLFGLCLLGSCVHVFFDLVNSFGVRVVWPLEWRPELAAVFIIDLILLALLIAPLVAARFNPARRHEFFRASQLAVAAYLVFCLANRAAASTALARATQNEPKEFSYVFPEPLGPHRWRGVTRHDDDYKLYLIHSLSGTVDLKEEACIQADDPRVLKARNSFLGRCLDAFFKAPVWLCEGDAVEAYDIRFRSLIFPSRRGFQFVFPADR
jgi:inner membrane protein